MSFQPEKINDAWQNAKKPSKRFCPGDPENHNACFESENRYSPLNSEGMDIAESTDIFVEASPLLDGESQQVKTKIPSIVIHSWVKDHCKTMENLKKELKEEFSVLTKRDRIILKTQNVEDYNKVLEAAKAARIECHTYSLPGTSPLKLILKGLPPNITPGEIKSDLTSNKFKVREVKQFLKNVENDGVKTEVKLPIYSVEFEPETPVKDVFKQKKVCFCLIHWEKLRTRNKVIQCFKCQAYGHFSKNCYKSLKCVLCTGAHALQDCPLKHKPDQLLKCANCGENHSAGSRDCMVYKRILENKEKQNSSARPRGTSNSRSLGNIRGRFFSGANNTDYNNKATYSQVAGQRPPESTTSTSEFSLTDLLAELKSIFGNINILNVLNVLKNLIFNLKRKTDIFSKIITIFEAISSLF